jgi:hypothetical protein
MKSRKLLIGLIGLAVLLVVGAVVLWPVSYRITQKNGDRIKEGMSSAEVEAILGPPGDYRSGPTDPDFPSPYPWQASGVLGPWPATWRGDRGVIYVYRETGADPEILGRDKNDPDRVSVAYFFEVRRIEQGPIDNLLWRVKRKWFLDSMAVFLREHAGERLPEQE